MIVGMATGASAAGVQPYGNPANGVQWRNAGGGYMNAYKNAPSEVTDGTKVTLYSYSSDTTQKFYTYNGALKCSANTNLKVVEFFDNTHGPSAYLKNSGYTDVFNFIPSGGGYKIVTSDLGGELVAVRPIGDSRPLAFTGRNAFPNTNTWIV